VALMEIGEERAAARRGGAPTGAPHQSPTKARSERRANANNFRLEVIEARSP
jgi:hypothetical protein